MPINVLEPVVANTVEFSPSNKSELLAYDAVNGVNVMDVAADDVVANEDDLAKDAVIAKEAVGGVNVMDVAADDVVANEAVVGVNVIEVAADAVVAKEAVGGTKVIDVAAEAVAVNDELIATLAVPKVEPLCVPMNEPVNEPVLTVNVIDVAADDVVAKEAVGGVNVIDVAADAVAGINVMDVAADAVVANEDDPNIDPVSYASFLQELHVFNEPLRKYKLPFSVNPS